MVQSPRSRLNERMDLKCTTDKIDNDDNELVTLKELCIEAVERVEHEQLNRKEFAMDDMDTEGRLGQDN